MCLCVGVFVEVPGHGYVTFESNLSLDRVGAVKGRATMLNAADAAAKTTKELLGVYCIARVSS